MTASRHLGLDLGATNLKWTVVERNSGVEGEVEVEAEGEAKGEIEGDAWRRLDCGEVRTRTDTGPEGVIEQLGIVGGQALQRWPDVASAGVGVPGLYDPRDGTTRFLVNIPGDWAARPVVAPLSTILGVPVALVNDARAFGLAELRLGAGRGASSMVGLTLGTGIGGVIVIEGKVVEGHDGTAGEIGHQTIDPDGPLCNCGNRGCLETFARADRIAAASGTETAEAAVDRARAGDQVAIDGLRRIGRYLGIGIANAITLIAPDRVVIGGGVAAAGDLLLEPIRAEIRARVRMTELGEVALVPAELGIWAGSIGAAIHGAERAAPGVSSR